MRTSTPIILVVGKPFSGLSSYLLAHNFEYIVLKDAKLQKANSKNVKRRTFCSFSSREEMLATVDALAQKHHIAAVMTVYEQYVLATAEIASHLKLPGLPIEAARACTDKYVMRQKFARAPKKISPDYAVVKSETDVRTFADTHTFPLILKPANLSKSLLVTKSESYDELIQNYDRTVANIEATYAKYAPNTTPKLLIEEFMEGPVHSVDAFVDSQGQAHVLDAVVDYQTGYDIGYDDNFHYSRLLPSTLSSSDIAEITEVAKLGCQALGMKNSPAHIEIILTNDGPRIVEIGARNGGYRERMHRLSNQLDITGNALRLALGEQPDISLPTNYPVGVFELFPKSPGIFTGLAHETELQRLPSLVYYSLKVTPGEFVGKSSDGFKMCAIVILHHTDSEQFKRDHTFLDQHVYVQTRPA